MSESLVKVKVHGHTGTIILNRPARRNALSRRLLAELNQALGDLQMEKRVRAVVLTGAGPAFCAGMDLAEMKQTAELDDPYAQWGKDAEIYRDVVLTMLRLPKPILAAVNGATVAGGAGLVLGCDIVVAAPEARFGMPEPRRGIVAGIVAPLLAFRIGAGHASRLLLTSMLVDAEEAHRLGLYHEVVAGDNVWARAAELADECAKGAPEALQLTKRLVNETIGEGLITLLSAGAAISATARTTAAASEGLQAFLEKRDPDWQ